MGWTFFPGLYFRVKTSIYSRVSGSRIVSVPCIDEAYPLVDKHHYIHPKERMLSNIISFVLGKCRWLDLDCWRKRQSFSLEKSVCPLTSPIKWRIRQSFPTSLLGLFSLHSLESHSTSAHCWSLPLLLRILAWLLLRLRRDAESAILQNAECNAHANRSHRVWSKWLVSNCSNVLPWTLRCSQVNLVTWSKKGSNERILYSCAIHRTANGSKFFQIAHQKYSLFAASNLI